MVSFTTIHAVDHKTYKHDGRVLWGTGLNHKSFRWHGLETHSCHSADIPKQSIVSLCLEHLHMVSSIIIHAIDHTTNRQDGAVV